VKQKIIVIGLGNFGGNLAIKLAEDGNEVFGIDKNPEKVDQIHSKISHALGLNTAEESSIDFMPIDDCDLIIVAIGENIGSSISTTALLRKYYKGRIIVRSLSPLHRTVLEAMHIDEIIEPEAEYAHDLSNRIMTKGAVKSMDLYNDYEILEVRIPPKIVGKTLSEIDIKNKYKAHIVTVVKQENTLNYLGSMTVEKRMHGIMHSVYTFEATDLLLVFGTRPNIDKFIEENQ